VGLIGALNRCTETNTGVSSVCLQKDRCATTFPSPAALASSFNRSLWRHKGETQSTEQRALFNLGAVRGSENRPLIGLNGWGPNINIVRGRDMHVVLHLPACLVAA
jgi:beta-glucosidase-like glycosyl hydrolase